MEPLLESLQDLNCPVCLEVSKSAVESQCCGHAFCQECVTLIKSKHNECPFCKCSPFACRQAKLLRRMISGIKIDCPNPNCKQKVSNANLPTHLEYCAFGEASCRVCNQKYLRGQLVKHTFQKHEEQIQRVVIDFHNVAKSKLLSTTGSKGGGSNISVEKSTVMDPASKIQNRAGRDATLGNTGKYYCGGPLIYKCTCCDGNCGPTNGENCLGCMQLDLKMRSLSKGYLVNAGGYITKVDFVKPYAYCGIPFGMVGNKKCSLGNSCRFCVNLTKSMKRYEPLLSQ